MLHLKATPAQQLSPSAYDETDITIIYNDLSSLVQYIYKHNVQIIGGVMNAQIGKGGNNNFYSHNLLKRNMEFQSDFSLKNSLACLNIKSPSLKKQDKANDQTFLNNSKAQLDDIFITKKVDE